MFRKQISVAKSMAYVKSVRKIQQLPELPFNEL